MEPVHVAARRNDVTTLSTLLGDDPELIEAEAFKRSPLFYASEAGSVDAVRLLLERGANVSKRDGHGFTPLLWACCCGRAEVVSLLLEHAADPSVCTYRRSTALILASYGNHQPGSDHVTVIRMLLGRVPVDARDIYGCTALWGACYYGHTERARVILLEGLADPTIANTSTDAPMAVARRERRQGCVRLLQWYEGELERAYVLSKAKAVADATESFIKAPPYLLRRMVWREALPEVEVVGQAGQQEEEEEERRAVYEYVVRGLAGDLFVELMQGLRYRKRAREDELD